MPQNSLDIWNSLNPRQQKYLSCIYEADQSAQKYEKTGWSPGRESRPASVWRWLPYSSDGYLRHLFKDEQLVDKGSGSTFAALRDRNIIDCKYEFGLFDSILYVKLTTLGRRVARAGLGESAPKKLPVGTLRDYQWKALVKAYRAGDEGLEAPEEEPGFYDGIGWKVWLRLRNYKSGTLVQEKKTKYRLNGDWEHRLLITDFGKKFIQENWEKYRDLYPEVEAIPQNKPISQLKCYINASAFGGGKTIFHAREPEKIRILMSDLLLVAVINNTDDPEDAFGLLQNPPRCNWWETGNPDITCIRPERSLSMGDVVETSNGEWWVCCYAGWAELIYIESENVLIGK